MVAMNPADSDDIYLTFVNGNSSDPYSPILEVFALQWIPLTNSPTPADFISSAVWEKTNIVVQWNALVYTTNHWYLQYAGALGTNSQLWASNAVLPAMTDNVATVSFGVSTTSIPQTPDSIVSRISIEAKN